MDKNQFSEKEAKLKLQVILINSGVDVVCDVALNKRSAGQGSMFGYIYAKIQYLRLKRLQFGVQRTGGSSGCTYQAITVNYMMNSFQCILCSLLYLSC